MLIPVEELLMAGSSVVATSCCLARPTRATKGERSIAAAMAILMGVMVIGAPGWVQYGAVAAGSIITASSVITTGVADGCTIDWHRAGGAALMVLVVLLHLHVVEMAGTQVHSSANDVPVVPEHDALLLLLVRAWTVAYAMWTAVIVLGLQREAGTRLLRLEHAAMALGILTMAFLRM